MESPLGDHMDKKVDVSFLKASDAALYGQWLECRVGRQP